MRFRRLFNPRLPGLATLPLLLSTIAFGQDVLVSISSEPRGMSYRVDNAVYTGPSSFTWPRGSTHVIEFVSRECAGAVRVPGVQYDADCRIRYSGPQWSTNKGPLVPTGVVAITADPEVHTFLLTALVEYRVDFGGSAGTPNPIGLPLPTAPLGARPTGGPAGLACIDMACYLSNVQLWLSPGEHTLQAFPFEGFAFTGWITNGGTPPQFQSSFRIPGPTVVIPSFEPGKRVEIYTEPRQLRVLIDRTEVPTIDPQFFALSPVFPVPGFFDWASGSVHVLAAPSPQLDRTGRLMVFDSWVNGAGETIGGQNSTFKVDLVNVRERLVARFIPGVRVSVVMPAGLTASVDGRDNWASLNFVWGVGTKHTVTAPAEQFDRNGRKYIFKRWSNGGPATQTITVDTADIATDIRLVAEYEKFGMLTVQSSVPGARIQVDGEACQTPCTTHRAMGRAVPVSASATVTTGPGARIEFVSWSDGGEPERTVQLGEEPVSISATYRYAFLLTVVSEPAGSADPRSDPPSSDGFYPVNTRVTVHAGTRAGFKFKRWEGDAGGILSPVMVTVGGPRQIRGVYEVTPHIAPAGIRSAAGEIPVPGVAPGSIVSVYGASLAEQLVTGRGNPLVQVLGDTTVYAGDRLLPLLFVSPGQINAQLPYDLPAGTHVLTVRNSNLPEVTSTFTVVRNAPGLFTTAVGRRALATVARVSGVSVSAADPVRGGELINLYGTGFGPHRNSPPEGFSVEESDGYRLADTVEVVVGDQTLTPEYAGSAAGLPGVVAVRFRLPDDLGSAATVTIRVNGVSSNTVVLPTAEAYASSADPAP